jgi:hypothetical protein
VAVPQKVSTHGYSQVAVSTQASTGTTSTSTPQLGMSWLWGVTGIGLQQERPLSANGLSGNGPKWERPSVSGTSAV